MISETIAYLTHLIINVINSTGYWGVFALMTAESALIPIPSEVTMCFAGYLVSAGSMNLWVLALVGAAANLAGSLLAFWLGWWGQEHVVRQLIRKYGKYLLITEKDLDTAIIWFNKYGQSISFFSRVLPVVRTFISLPAGIARMSVWKFSYLTFLGSFLWSLFLAYIGMVMGDNWTSIEVYYRKFEYLIVGAGAIIFIWLVLHKISEIRKQTRATTDANQYRNDKSL
jgi:membrane protein DedA with SNARE-associated domain